jgi:hypothetical protein
MPEPKYKDPLLPTEVDTPVPKYTEPLFPALDSPVLKTRIPLTPEVAAFAEDISTLPLDS